MGDRNILTKKYMGQNDIFADLCNFFLFDGQTIIKPDNLTEKDLTELGKIYTDKGRIEIERVRDLLRNCTVKTADEVTYMIIGVENQSDIHYAMVVRNMVQDALNYAAQVEACTKKHRQNKDLSTEEYLSGFSKKDKLVPVVTITVYWDSGDWDGPRCLHEMFDLDNKILDYVPDYKLNLVIPSEIKDFQKFKTELGSVMEFLRCSDNKDKMRKFLSDNSNSIILSNDAVELLNCCVNAKIKISKEKGVETGMCIALDELREEFRLEGILEGRLEGRLEGEELMGRLVTVLSEHDRNDDIIKAAKDKEFRNKLYIEYGLS